MTARTLPAEWEQYQPLRQAHFLRGTLTRQELYRALARTACFPARDVGNDPRLDKQELAMILTMLLSGAPEPDADLIWGAGPRVRGVKERQDRDSPDSPATQGQQR